MEKKLKIHLAMKMEIENNHSNSTLIREAQILKKLKGVLGVPEIFDNDFSNPTKLY